MSPRPRESPRPLRPTRPYLLADGCAVGTNPLEREADAAGVGSVLASVGGQPRAGARRAARQGSPARRRPGTVAGCPSTPSWCRGTSYARNDRRCRGAECRRAHLRGRERAGSRGTLVAQTSENSFSRPSQTCRAQAAETAPCAGISSRWSPRVASTEPARQAGGHWFEPSIAHPRHPLFKPFAGAGTEVGGHVTRLANGSWAIGAEPRWTLVDGNGLERGISRGGSVEAGGRLLA